MKEPQYTLTLEQLKAESYKGGGYQRFDVDFATKTLHPHDKHKAKHDLLLEYMHTVFPGKSVIDLGCNKGLYSYMAHRAGARTVLGNDKSNKLAQYRRLLYQCLKCPITFSEENFFDDYAQPVPQADCVMALAMLHEVEKGSLEDKIKRIRSMSIERSLIEFCEDYQVEFGESWNVEIFKRIVGKYYSRFDLLAKHKAWGINPGFRYIFDCEA